MTEYILSGELMSVILDTIKTAYENDVPEIVRCGDCKHVDEIMTRYAGMQYACMHFDDATVTPDGFCAWGERRSE